MRTTDTKSSNLRAIWNFIKYSLKTRISFLRYFCSKVGRYYHLRSGVQGSEGLKFQWKYQKNIRIFLEVLERWLTYKLTKEFSMLFKLFYILFNPFTTGNRKNRIIEMWIVPQTLIINNVRTTSTKSINLHTNRKFIKYSLENVSVKRQCLLLHFSRYYCSKVVQCYLPKAGYSDWKG